MGSRTENVHSFYHFLLSNVCCVSCTYLTLLNFIVMSYFFECLLCKYATLEETETPQVIWFFMPFTYNTYFFEELPFFQKNVQKQLLFESCKWNEVYSAPNLKILFSKMCNFEGLIYVDQNSTFGQWQNCNIYNFKIGLSRFRWLYKVVLIGIFLKAKGNLSKAFLHLIFFACSMVW